DIEESRRPCLLLASLKIPQSLPILKDIMHNDDAVLLRRAAAVGLRQLQTPESIPVMEHILTNPGDDRFVRLSAAYGLAESGRPLGVTALAQIFQESAADGRGRDVAFRALPPRNDQRPPPSIRKGVASEAGPRGGRGLRGATRLCRGAPNVGGYGGPFRGPPYWLTAYRGVPRLRRGAPSAGGYGGPFRGPPYWLTAMCYM